MAARDNESKAIGPWQAVWHAVLNRNTPYFPRPNVGAGQPPPDQETIAEVLEELKRVSPSPKDLAKAMPLARQTLDEVKDQTAYQDSKATRLLTILTFLSALATLLFGKLVDMYPPHDIFRSAALNLWESVLLAAAYIGFGVFVLFAASGALVTFHAIRTRFRYPESLPSGPTKSFLFYRGILAVRPSEWAKSFVAPSDQTKLNTDLSWRYFENYLVESYLISAKVADKIRYLVPAQQIQFWAIRVLVFWGLIFAATVWIVEPVGGGTTVSVEPAPSQRDSAEASTDSGSQVRRYYAAPSNGSVSVD